MKKKMKKPRRIGGTLLAGLLLISGAVYAQENDAGQGRALDSIRKGLDNGDMIQTLRVRDAVIVPAGSVKAGALAGSSVSNSTLAVSQRTVVITVTPLTATWTSATPAQVTLQVADTDGNAHTGRVLVSTWTSASTFGAPSATSTGVLTFATGTIIQTGTVQRVLTDTGGKAVWTLGTAATGQVFVVGAVAGSVSSAAINLQ